MAQTKTYTVTLIPAEKTPDRGTGFSGFSFQPFDKRAVKQSVTATSLTDLETKIRALITQTSAVMVWLPRGERKPAGFEAWHRHMNFIEVPPHAIAAE